MRKYKKIISLSLLLLIAIASTGCSNNNKKNPSSDLINQEGVLATVNGKAITQKEFDETLAAYKKMVETQYGEGAWDKEISPGKTLGSFYKDTAIMENMILDRVLVDAAVKDGIKMTDEELTTELNVYKGYFDNDEGYQEFLKTNEMSEEYLKEAIKKEFIINHYIDKNIETLVPTDDELKELFKEFKMDQKIRASHILVNTEEEAKAVVERLNKGEAFEAVAKDVSIDPSKDKGGDLDYFNYPKMVKEFSDAAFAMNIGDVSAPVKTKFGYHVIKVTDKKTDNSITVENSKDILTEGYKTKKYNELVENLKKNADIKVK